ncbi:acyl-CoA-binding domain-containing protein 5-like [Porites lutea]|uniref:acyl-CoA-binding domain-containing protein 5-like n=1 Tax=Porites lutea TaxID=51062 RepID=UPI003CC6A82C
MAGPVEARFDAAVNVVRSMPKKGAYQPSYDTMLKFYAFYKQAKEGECCESKPGFWDVVKKAKWEAWHGLGQMSKEEAMESYVFELKKVMQNLPNADEAAEFSEVLKSFYKVAYEGQDEPLPAILKVFEDEKPLQTIRIKEGLKSNGHHNPHHNSVPNGLIIKVPEVNGSCDEFSPEINGFPHQDSLAFGGFPHRDSLDLRNNGDYKLMEHQFSNGVNPVVIISPEDFEKHKEERDDSGFQNGISEVPPLRPSTRNADIPLPSVKNGLVLTSDESEDEFCDSIGPEHLHELQNGNNVEDQHLNLDDTLEQKIDSVDGSNCSGSPEHATNSTLTELSENSDLENNVQGSQLLTSTPYSKHVTFAVESSDSDRPVVVSSDLSQVVSTVREESCSEITSTVENGQASQADVAVTEFDLPGLISSEGSQKPSGILKSHHPVRECGGGDTSQHPSGRNHASRTWQTQGTRSKEGSSQELRASRFPRGHRRRGDSDSEDDDFTSDHTSGPDYDSAGDEVNDRILQALERLHQDMKSVLRRLSSMEEAVIARQDASPTSEQPWWKAFIPSKPLLFLILWPFIVNIIFYYFRQRKNSKRR